MTEPLDYPAPDSSAVSTPPAGWYADTVTAGQYRYWDGKAWTPHVSASPPVQKAGQDPSDPVHWILPTGRSSMAVVAGYLAIVAVFAPFLIIFGPLAIIFGLLGLKEIKRDGSHGKGRAWFGIIGGAFSTLIVGLLFLPLLTQ